MNYGLVGKNFHRPQRPLTVGLTVPFHSPNGSWSCARRLWKSLFLGWTKNSAIGLQGCARSRHECNIAVWGVQSIVENPQREINDCCAVGFDADWQSLLKETRYHAYWSWKIMCMYESWANIKCFEHISFIFLNATTTWMIYSLQTNSTSVIYNHERPYLNEIRFVIITFKVWW